MNERGHPIVGAIAGFFLGLFGALVLFQVKVFDSSSPLFMILPIVGLVLGIALALWAPFGRSVLVDAGPRDSVATGRPVDEVDEAP